MRLRLSLSREWEGHSFVAYFLRHAEEPYALHTTHLSLFHFPRPPQGATRFRAGVLSVFDHLYTIDKYVFDAGRVLMRFFKGGVICDCRRIEHDHVRKHSLFEKSAMVEA